MAASAIVGAWNKCSIDCYCCRVVVGVAVIVGSMAISTSGFCFAVANICAGRVKANLADILGAAAEVILVAQGRRCEMTEIAVVAVD